MRRLGISCILFVLAGCSAAGDGERCNPLEFDVVDQCADGLSCVYPTAPMCGVAYCCAVDSKGNITDKNPNCQPDPSLVSVCMLDLSTTPVDSGTTD